MVIGREYQTTASERRDWNCHGEPARCGTAQRLPPPPDQVHLPRKRDNDEFPGCVRIQMRIRHGLVRTRLIVLSNELDSFVAPTLVIRLADENPGMPPTSNSYWKTRV